MKKAAVRCKDGYNFYVYASWCSRKCTMIVRPVTNGHKCRRSILKNSQVKCYGSMNSSCQYSRKKLICLLWSCKKVWRLDLVCVFQGGLLVGAKQVAHKMLHGSMKEHYGNWQAREICRGVKEVKYYRPVDSTWDTLCMFWKGVGNYYAWMGVFS